MIRPVAITVLAALTVTACSGADEPAADTAPAPTIEAEIAGPASSAPPATERTETTGPADTDTTTDDAVADETVPSTAPPATATETTTPPATTDDTDATDTTGPTAGTEPLDDDLQAIIDVVEAAEDAWEAFHYARMSPGDVDRVAALDTHFSVTVIDSVRKIMSDLDSAGERIIESSEVPASFDVDPISAIVDVGDGRASVEGCITNSFIRVRDDGGSDVVVDDSVSISVHRQAFVLEDAVWKFVSSTVIDEGEGVASCDR